MPLDIFQVLFEAAVAIAGDWVNGSAETRSARQVASLGARRQAVSLGVLAVAARPDGTPSGHPATRPRR